MLNLQKLFLFSIYLFTLIGNYNNFVNESTFSIKKKESHENSLEKLNNYFYSFINENSEIEEIEDKEKTNQLNNSFLNSYKFISFIYNTKSISILNINSFESNIPLYILYSQLKFHI